MSSRKMGFLIVVLLLLSALPSLRAATVTYTHDAAGRVTKVVYGNGKGLVYTYDANGNLVSRTPVTPQPPARRRAVGPR
jgi:YD repeat-containing protein